MKRETGFTLLELMVAMTVTLVILAATLSLFQTALQTSTSGTQLSTLNGNLRSAMGLITRDLLQAGQGIPTGGVAIPISGGCQKINRPMPVGLGGTFPYGCTFASAANLPAVIPGNALGPSIPTGPGGTSLGNPIFTAFPTGAANSDMVTMLYQDNNLVTNEIFSSGQPFNNFLQTLNWNSMTFSPAVVVNNTSNGINIGDIFMVYGGGLYRYVVVTAIAGQVATYTPLQDAFKLNQQPSSAPGGACPISGTLCDIWATGSVPFGGTCTYTAGTPPVFTNTTANACAATAQRVLMISYFLDTNTVINGQVIPRLMRQINMTKTPAACSTASPPAVGCPNSVAEVIEALEFSYDYVNGTPPCAGGPCGPITNVVSTAAAEAKCACAVTDNQIRKVNIFLAGRSDTLLSPTGQFSRSNVATQVDIRSLAFINRYQ